jgi:invasion protein IalB
MEAWGEERFMFSCRRYRSVFAHGRAAVATLAAFASAFLITAPAFSQAQGQGQGQTEAQEIAAWRVECSGDGKTLDCRALQQLFQRDSRQLVISMLVRKAANDPRGASVTMQLPLGLNLVEPIQLKVDNGPVEKQAIQTCTNVGCFLVFNANAAFVTALRSGTELKIGMQDINKRSVELALPLIGFGIAFDKARS